MSGYIRVSGEQAAFDKCHEVYRACWDECYVKRHMQAVTMEAFKKSNWKPDRKPRPEDFLADFAIAGETALAGEGFHSRLILFRAHYVSLAPWESVRHFLGLSEMGWVRWTEDIRKVVGSELVRRGVYPVKAYFEEMVLG